jgi:hypothetical protein
MKFFRDHRGSGEVGKWGSGEVGKWGSGVVGKWGSGEVGKWGSGVVGKWGSGEVGEFQLKPQHPNTPTPPRNAHAVTTLSPASCLLNKKQKYNG